MNFLNLYWNMNGKPTLCIYLTENRLKWVHPYKVYAMVIRPAVYSRVSMGMAGTRMLVHNQLIFSAGTTLHG